MFQLKNHFKVGSIVALNHVGMNYVSSNVAKTAVSGEVVGQSLDGNYSYVRFEGLKIPVKILERYLKEVN